MTKPIIPDDVAERVVLLHDALVKLMRREEESVARKTKILREAISQVEEDENGQG